VERFRPREESPLRACLVPAGEKVLSHVSNFREVKRVGDVVGIFARVARKIPARLILAGDGPEIATAERVAREAGVADRVHFLGEQEDVERVYAASDLFLLPSEHESFGLSALEALACGVPVIGTDAGGLPEVVQSGRTGVLVEVGDVEGAAEQAVALLRDEPRRRRMGAAAREDAVARFGGTAVVDRYVALYERALGG